MNPKLIQKYNVPGPRYTSYPTVPYWNTDEFSVSEYCKTVEKSFEATNKSDGISLYIHLPFCESMCTFCGCTKRITKNHSVEAPYIAAVLKEWRLYCQLFQQKPNIKELHIGGGTPTFFSPEHLEDLINGIFALANKRADCEMSFEGHPNNTTKEHLQKLYDLGFRRVSFGVQDYSDKVQKAINRVQPFANVAKVTLWAREIGYESVGHDIIFGLPFQTKEDVIDTIEKTASLHPDRLAFYGYAHTPWVKGVGQRGFKDEDLPKDSQKRDLYETGKRMLEQCGYHEIGMDHFALATDGLFKAMTENRLHRNFMGYTDSKTQLMIGLGVSAIGDSWHGFGQNSKNLSDYYQLLEWNQLPIVKGHILTDEDVIVRTHILNLMCRFETSWKNPKMLLPNLHHVIFLLKDLRMDGLLEIFYNGIKVSETGRAFVRNICMAFDLRLQRKLPASTLFSATV